MTILANIKKEIGRITLLEGEVDERMPPVMDGLVAFYPFDSTLEYSEPVIWSNTNSGVDITSNKLTKNRGTSSWDSGALSEKTFDGDCFIEWQMEYVISTEGAEMVGFSESHTTWSYTDLDYAIYTHDNGLIRVFSLGVNQGTFSSWSPDKPNVFRIEIRGSTAYFYHNGIEIHSMATVHSGALQADCSLHSSGYANSIVGAKIGVPANSVLENNAVLTDDGVDVINDGDYVSIPNPVTTGEFTIHFRCKANYAIGYTIGYPAIFGMGTYNSNNSFTIMDTGATSATGIQKLIRKTSTGTWSWASDAFTSASNYMNNNLYTVVKDATNYRMFLNGELIGTRNHGATTMGSLIHVGHRVNGDRTANSTISDLSIYNRAFPDAEVETFYNTYHSLKSTGKLISQLDERSIDPASVEGYYPLQGDALDYSDSENDGSWVGTTPGTSDGKYGDTYDWAGTGEIALTNKIVLPHGSWTIAYWFKSSRTVNEMTIGTGDENYNRFYHVSPSSVASYVRIHTDDGGTFDIPFGEITSDNVYRHLCVVAEGDTITAYVNGEYLMSGTETTNGFEIDTIGDAYTGDTYRWWGKLEEVFICNEPLHADQVKSLFLSPYSLPKGTIQLGAESIRVNEFSELVDPPVNPLDLDVILNLDAAHSDSYPGTGNIWYDLSGNDYHGQGSPGDADGYNDNYFPVWNPRGYFDFYGKGICIVPDMGSPTKATHEVWVYQVDGANDYISDARRSGGLWNLTNYNSHNLALFSNNLKANDPVIYQADSNWWGSGSWLQIIFTMDESVGSTLYVNGQPIIDARLVSHTAGDAHLGDNFHIGCRYTGYFSWQKYFAAYRIYNQVVTDEEADLLFQITRHRFGI